MLGSSEEDFGLWRMDCLVDELVKCKRMEVSEIVMLGMVVEAEILGWKAYEDKFQHTLEHVA